jgi:excisionase family DNA binding protein
MPIDHVSVATAAQMLGRCEETVRRWIRSGKLPVIRYPSRQQRVTRAAIAKILTENKHTTPRDTSLHPRVH